MSEARFRFVAPREHTVSTSDGIELWTDVYLPEGEGPWPVVLLRTPYGRRRPTMMKLASLLARSGLAVVLQDMRGRFRTRGELLAREGEDGLDTLAWLARQPWSNGRVALCGISLSGFSQLLLATLPPPPGIEIRTVINMAGVVDLHSALHPGGALILHWALPWCSMMHEQWNKKLAGWQQMPWAEALRHLPLADAAERVGGTIALWTELFSRHPTYGPPWRRFDLREPLERLRVPVLHLGGWYDYILGQVLTGYQAIGQGSAAPPAQGLVIGPWDHQTLFVALLASKMEVTRLGLAAPVDLTVPLRHWLARWLEDTPPEEERLPEALLFVMGEDAWIRAERFPVPGAAIEEWFLTSGGHAATAGGDGRLLREHPSAPGQDGFVYDPSDPVPTCGGALWPFPTAGLVPGPEDQSALESRQDVLVFTSAPLDEDLIVVGVLEVVLWVASSCPDTDFTAKLVDVDTAGVPRVIQDGVLRARYRESLAREALLEPGQPTELRISLGATGHRFAREHRLRLEISSSNFPKYDRNWNTAAVPASASGGPPAHQVVFHGGAMPSRLRLPVLSRADFEAHRFTPPAAWLERGDLGGAQMGEP